MSQNRGEGGAIFWPNFFLAPPWKFSSYAPDVCYMWNAYVDAWDMLNNFYFQVYAQKSLFIGENGDVFFQPLHPILWH